MKSKTFLPADESIHKLVVIKIKRIEIKISKIIIANLVGEYPKMKALSIS
jgi:hypothetical protein